MEDMIEKMQEDSLKTYINYLQRLSPITLDFITASTSKEFDEAFDKLLEKALQELETSKKDIHQLNEDGLSSFMASALSIGEVIATREKSSNGHVDLTVSLNNSQFNWVKLGEAKIWDGNKYHVGGLEQLLTRYTTGRECRGFVISYVKKKDVKGLFEKLRAYIDEKKPINLEGLCKDHNIRWSFLSDHKHSSGELVEVHHVGCNLYVE